MKKILPVTVFVLSAFFVNAQHAEHKTVQADPTLSVNLPSPIEHINNAVKLPLTEALAFRESEYNFGKIPQGKPVTHIFEITNTGKTPYKLDNVVASCGCTTPQWDKEKVINSGEKSTITVGYNAAAEGPFTKPVTITYNGTQTKVITIKGEVWKTPAASAPANSALNDFKN